METVNILHTFLYWYGVGQSFSLNTAAILLHMDPYKFWTVSSRVLYNFSRTTSSSFFRDVGSGNLLLTLVSKLTGLVHWCSNLVTVLAKEYDELHLLTLQTMTEQFQLCEWGHWYLRILHYCSKIMSGSWNAPTAQHVHILTCSKSAMKGTNGTNSTVPRHCCPNHNRTSPMFHCWNLVFQIVGFLGVLQM
jgi:hypothetical protein